MKTEDSAPPAATKVLEGDASAPVQPTKPASVEPAKPAEVTDQAPTPCAPSPVPPKPKATGGWTYFHDL